jgi:enoyl-CoA hydratase/carnithine racemase
MTGQVQFHAPCSKGIARIVFSHPGKLNALDQAMWRSLTGHMKHLAADAELQARTRVVVLQGEGGAFISGGDIEEFLGFRFDRAQLEAFHEDIVATALQSLLDCDIPLIAEIVGPCVGGGLEIACCCDLRLASDTSRYGVPIAKLGFPMAPREMEIVAAVVGPTVLRELLLEARVLSAAEAQARGMLTRVVPEADLAAHVQASAEAMARLSPQALRLNKRALREFTNQRGSQRESRSACFDYAPSAEHREGLLAFIERRPADFSTPTSP